MRPDELTVTRQPDHDEVMFQQFRAAFQSELESGKSSSIDAWIDRVPFQYKRDVFAELLKVEIHFRQQSGQAMNRDDYLTRFPDFRRQIEMVFDAVEEQEAKSSNSISMASTNGPTKVYEPPASAQKRWYSGKTVGHSGRYRLNEFVGRGGFGEVWKGYDSELDREIAIKVPRDRPSQQNAETMTFRDEARRAAKVKHNGIVEIYDVGEVEDGFFIISEFIDGPTLAQRMKSERIPRDESVRIVHAIALILDKAHVDGLFHRDIKPSNILLRKDSSPVITDFGLAVSEEEQLTLEPGVVGTLVYMSPEQARGETRLLDGRSDLYSLGVILFQLLTGRLPFQFRTEADLLEQIIHREVRPLRSIDDTVPARLDEICLKCLSKEVKYRYATGKDLATELDSYLTSIETPVTLANAEIHPGIAEKKLRPAIQLWKPLSAIVMTALVAGIAWSAVTPKRGNPDQPDQNRGSDSQLSINPLLAVPQQLKLEWRPLLDDAVEKISAIRQRETDFLQQDVTQSMLTARVEDSFWLLSTKHVGKAPFRIRGRVYVDNWIGTVGFVWGLSNDVESPEGRFPRCYACVIERLNPANPVYLSLREIRTTEFFPDMLTIGRQDTLNSKEITTPKDAPVDLEISIDQDGVIVKIDFVEVWKAEIFDVKVSDEIKTNSGNLGVIIRGKTVVVSDAAVGF